MLKLETFINNLDGKTLIKITSDSNYYVKELATGNLYAEAIIPLSRSASEFKETDKEIEKEEYYGE